MQRRPEKLTYLLHSAELGIDADTSNVNLVEGENFKPEFLKLVSCSRRIFFFTRLLKPVFSEPECHPPHPDP